jgi:hypothetical protein
MMRNITKMTMRRMENMTMITTSWTIQFDYPLTFYKIYKLFDNFVPSYLLLFPQLSGFSTSDWACWCIGDNWYCILCFSCSLGTLSFLFLLGWLLFLLFVLMFWFMIWYIF